MAGSAYELALPGLPVAEPVDGGGFSFLSAKNSNTKIIMILLRKENTKTLQKTIIVAIYEPFV